MGNGSRRPGPELIGVMGLFGVPGGPAGKEPNYQGRRCKRHRFEPWKIPWKRNSSIPWTEDPGGPQSMGLQRIRDDWAHTRACTHTHTHTNTGWPKTMTISTLLMQGEAVCF